MDVDSVKWRAVDEEQLIPNRGHARVPLPSTWKMSWGTSLQLWRKINELWCAQALPKWKRYSLSQHTTTDTAAEGGAPQSLQEKRQVKKSVRHSNGKCQKSDNFGTFAHLLLQTSFTQNTRQQGNCSSSHALVLFCLFSAIFRKQLFKTPTEPKLSPRPLWSASSLTNLGFIYLRARRSI